MANEILVKSGTPVVWADATDYAGDGGTRTHQLDLTSLADGAARQGAKADLGATRAKQYTLTLCAEMAIAPVARAPVAVYWAASPHATAGVLNPGECSGADAAYTGSTGSSIEDSLMQLMPMGSLSLTADATTLLQIYIATLFPQHRYGMPVIINDGGQAFVADAVEMFVSLTPIIPEIQ